MNGSRRSSGPEAAWLLLAPGLLWLLGLFVLPLLWLLPLSLAEARSRFALQFSVTGRLANYGEALHQHGPLLLRSLLIAGLAAALALLISYPLACFIAFRGGRWRSLLTGLVVPLEALGVLQEGRLLNTPAAVVGGLAYNAVPFLVLPLVVSLERIGPLLLEAAADLHAGPWTTFRRVVWPLSRPGLAAGLSLSLVPAVGDVIHPQLLGGPNDRMVGNALQTLVLVQRDLPRGAALTVLLIALLLVTVLLGLRGSGSDELPLP